MQNICGYHKKIKEMRHTHFGVVILTFLTRIKKNVITMER